METTATVNGIIDVFSKFRMAPLPIDQFEQTGKAVLTEKISTFVIGNRPVEFSMLGFPMKSINTRDKVLGMLPDMAEEVTFQNFATFNEKVKQVYKPGVQFSIVSDGFVFADILGATDETVERYEDVAIEMSHVAPVKMYDLRDFYEWHGTTDDMRKKVVEQFGITPIELEKRVLLDPDVNNLYRGMIKFMTEELAIRNYPSNSQLQKAAKSVAREMMLRNEAYSALVQKEFSSKIRLSMHPSINSGKKFSFQLIPGDKIWTSPWHCALLVDETGDFATIHRKDAELKGYHLRYQQGRPYYFTAN